MRDTIQKRTYSEFEEASYTKQKRLMAVKAVAEMKRKLEDASQTAADSGTNLVKTIMVLRADAGRAEAARAGPDALRSVVSSARLRKSAVVKTAQRPDSTSRTC
ncbi:hypothetical protein PC129_g7843 [Phytophthora cactorum]|uniref:Uncharacterized protein n=1 Tax=Phytophthora cactorum TaxID=29920 RepID=A0A329S4X2_9STRA|nr:hypothetical protein PC112_g9773 [Phytophthora cactorum]KAG2826866.1 hypothetical protein PC111_g8811 [Phytophthora cactorum]KAG2857527.1 hypothetical protein PC113_g10626 [Phytophthora cactorum]KAG2907327.1 hypothetical protein PC114_g10836 [Phytophthora cactorum]KAG2922200.1 hypothetical protein PC115_g9325 [Phytophthora cactorum]